MPIVAAVNGPAVGLGCSLVALSDIVFMAESAHLADPHVMVGLVAADGGPVTWPLLTSLQLAKEYALTGDRIPARRAAEIGLVNHVCADDEVLDQAVACAHRIAKLPKQAVEDTKRILNLHLERAVLATLDFALDRRGPLVPLAGAAGQPRPPPRAPRPSSRTRLHPLLRPAGRPGARPQRGSRGGSCRPASRSSPRPGVRERAEPKSSSSTRTRRMERWSGCSVVNPMPASTCWQWRRCRAGAAARRAPWPWPP